MLRVENLTVRYGGRTIVDGAGFSVEENQWLMIVGPNGAGKSTLLNAISQCAPYEGKVTFREGDAAREKPAELARKIGVLRQNHNVCYGFTVEEVVRLGRYAWSRGMMAGESREDREKIDQALADTGMEPLRRQSVLTLSGGELQRTFLAQALAQDPQLLLLDEPANHLDLVYQKQVFDLIDRWLRQPGRAVASVVHDLSLARRYGTHALLLNSGRVVARGEMDQVLTRDRLNSVYKMDVAGWMSDLLTVWEDSAD